jgi:hypothetical protein
MRPFFPSRSLLLMSFGLSKKPEFPGSYVRELKLQVELPREEGILTRWDLNCGKKEEE